MCHLAPFRGPERPFGLSNMSYRSTSAKDAFMGTCMQGTTLLYGFLLIYKCNMGDRGCLRHSLLSKQQQSYPAMCQCSSGTFYQLRVCKACCRLQCLYIYHPHPQLLLLPCPSADLALVALPTAAARQPAPAQHGQALLQGLLLLLPEPQ